MSNNVNECLMYDLFIPLARQILAHPPLACTDRPCPAHALTIKPTLTICEHSLAIFGSHFKEMLVELLERFCDLASVMMLPADYGLTPCFLRQGEGLEEFPAGLLSSGK